MANVHRLSSISPSSHVYNIYIYRPNIFIVRYNGVLFCLNPQLFAKSHVCIMGNVPVQTLVPAWHLTETVMTTNAKNVCFDLIFQDKSKRFSNSSSLTLGYTLASLLIASVLVTHIILLHTICDQMHFIYFCFKAICSPDCGIGGTCVFDVSLQNFKCECLPGYSGEDCSQGTVYM